MGVFHRTLLDAEEELKSGKIEVAESIIDEHINEEHSLNGAFNIMMRNLAIFQDELNTIKENVSSAKEVHGKKRVKNVDNAVDAIRKAEKRLLVIIDAGKYLIREAELEE